MQLTQSTYYPLMSAQSPTAQTGEQTAFHNNSETQATATLSNTSAGYTTLGGKFRFSAVAGSPTDYALFAYQVPSTHRLVVMGITISTINTGTAVATTANVLDWSVGINSTDVSLATTDSGSTFGPRRIPVGTQGFLVGAGIGTRADDISVPFYAPLLVEPSRYFHVILQIPSGTATASQTIRGTVCVNGYFEKI